MLIGTIRAPLPMTGRPIFFFPLTAARRCSALSADVSGLPGERSSRSYRAVSALRCAGESAMKRSYAPPRRNAESSGPVKRRLIFFLIVLALRQRQPFPRHPRLVRAVVQRLLVPLAKRRGVVVGEEDVVALAGMHQVAAGLAGE